MTDISHIFGGDLAWSPAGDIAVSDVSAEGRQRVLRRILTIPGNYIWELAYGGGGAALVGSIATSRKVEAVLRAQMFMEACVSQTPPPTVQVSQITNGLSINISYIDAQTADSVYLAFSVT